MYLVRASDVCWKLGQILSLHLVSGWIKIYLTWESTNFNCIAMNSTSYIPPWPPIPPVLQISMHLLGNKSEVSPTVRQSKFNKLLYLYDVYIRMFPNGSRIETRGILLTLDMLPQSTGSQLQFISDSVTSARSSKRDLSYSLILKFYVACIVYYHVVSMLFVCGCPVTFNTQVTWRQILLQKQLLPVSNLTVLHPDYSPLIHRPTKHWHQSWNSEIQNKLHAIEPRMTRSVYPVEMILFFTG